MSLLSTVQRWFEGSATHHVHKKRRLLFVCTEGLHRSRTAAKMMDGSRDYEVRFGATNPGASNPIDQNLVDWADVIFVMSEQEDGHRTFLERFFNTKGKIIHDLDIPKVFTEGDKELVKLLRKRISAYIDLDV